MNRLIGLSALLALTSVVACNGGEETGTEVDPCEENSVEEVFPADGVTNAYYRTVVDIRLDDPDDSATLVVSSGGTEVAGSVATNEEHLVFTPTDPLASSTAYDVTVTYASGACTVNTTFTTSEVGAALTDSSILEGKAYDLDLESGRFVEPEGVGSLLGKYLGDVTLYLSPTTVTATEITMIGALGDDTDPTMQSQCDPTIDFPAADFTGNPYFEVDATGQSTTISVSGITVAIDDLKVSGAFAPDGSYIAGGVLAGSIDTRPLVDLVEEGGAPDAICELASSIGVDCEDCGGGEVFCLSLYVDNLSAVEANTEISALPDVCAQTDATTICPDDCPAQ